VLLLKNFKREGRGGPVSRPGLRLLQSKREDVLKKIIGKDDIAVGGNSVSYREGGGDTKAGHRGGTSGGGVVSWREGKREFTYQSSTEPDKSR